MKNHKVIVFGKGEAGKSTFINTVVPNATNIEHKGRTVAMDFGKVIVGNFAYHLYGTPGQARFEVVREVLSAYADSALMIFDSSTGICHEVKGILDEVVALKIPFLAVLNNKTTLPQLTSTGDIEALCSRHPDFIGLHEGDVRNPDFSHGILTSLQKA
jgi:signal recognition particle receptor subunit beta